MINIVPNKQSMPCVALSRLTDYNSTSTCLILELYEIKNSYLILKIICAGDSNKTTQTHQLTKHWTSLCKQDKKKDRHYN